MPSVTLHAESLRDSGAAEQLTNNLPSLLQTPSGLAILEVQGTIHAPFPQFDNEDARVIRSNKTPAQTQIGRLEFPLFNPSSDSSDLRWMKRAYLYVGKHQRLTGEVKKLQKPLLVVGKRTEAKDLDQALDKAEKDQEKEELEVLEIIRHKILFGGRPEPVGD